VEALTILKPVMLLLVRQIPKKFLAGNLVEVLVGLTGIAVSIVEAKHCTMLWTALIRRR